VLFPYGRSVKSQATVQEFDVLREIHSDKASVEITSPFDGVLKEILVKEGEVAKVGEALCLIETEDDEQVESEGLAAVEPPSADLRRCRRPMDHLNLLPNVDIIPLIRINPPNLFDPAQTTPWQSPPSATLP